MPNYPLWVPVRDSVPTVQASSATTGPAGGATLASVTLTVPGLYDFWIHSYLGGTGQSTPDSNNMQLVKTSGAVTTTILSPILVPPQANGSPEDIIVSALVTSGDVVAVKAIGAGTGTVIYNVTLVARIINGNAP